MPHPKPVVWFATFLGTLVVSVSSVHAADIGGTIASTLTITEDSQLVDDVTCTVTGAACIAIGAPNVTLQLNGFTITGLADPKTACAGGGMAGEPGIFVNGQTNVTINGPGLVQQFRNGGILLNSTTRNKVIGVTASTNCFSGIWVAGPNSAENELYDNITVRNGHGVNPCGGIWLAGGASRNRLRGNRTSGNGIEAQGNNFGIGIVSAAATGNVIEENTIVGNTNGIVLLQGVRGNLFRRNFVAGNPPVQIAVTTPTTGGVDVKNLGEDGTNTFQANVCLTSVNAPCPASALPSLTATPNPIPVTGAAVLGMTTISWMALGAEAVEVRVGSPNGALFVGGGSRGSAHQTGLWVTDGMTFYLQDISGGKPLTAENTLATVVVRLQRR